MLFRVLLAAALVTAAAVACTLKLDVPAPTVVVKCFVVELPGGQTSEQCPDDAGADGE